MTRIKIYSFISYNSLKKIPNHALTHYISDAFPTYESAPRTTAGFASKPAIQRKISKKARPIVADAHAAATPRPTMPKAHAPRAKFRKNIDKAALARYFDNDVLPSPAEMAQNWYMTVTALLNAMDKIKAEIANAEQEQLIDFVESLRAPKQIINKEPCPEWMPEWAEIVCKKHNIKSAQELIDTMLEYYGIDLDDDFMVIDENKKTTDEISHVGINSIDATESDKFERLFFEEQEFNKVVRDKFINKYHGADTAAAMRAFEKKKHSTQKIDYLLRKIQKTK